MKLELATEPRLHGVPSDLIAREPIFDYPELSARLRDRTDAEFWELAHRAIATRASTFERRRFAGAAQIQLGFQFRFRTTVVG
jgi:hypothetical protein